MFVDEELDDIDFIAYQNDAIGDEHEDTENAGDELREDGDGDDDSSSGRRMSSFFASSSKDGKKNDRFKEHDIGGSTLFIL